MCNLSINTLSTATIPYSQIQATNPTTNLTKRHNHQVRNSRKICLERLQSPNHRAAKHTISLNFKQTPNRDSLSFLYVLWRRSLSDSKSINTGRVGKINCLFPPIPA